MDSVLHNVKKLLADEADRIGRMQKASSAAELRAIFAGHSYADDEAE